MPDPTTLILIATLAGHPVPEWEVTDSELCRAIVEETKDGRPVVGRRDSGEWVIIMEAECKPDTLALRIELEGGSQGACGEGV